MRLLDYKGRNLITNKIRLKTKISCLLKLQIMCKRYQTKDECMKVIDENCKYRPNIMSLDAGEVFIGGRYHRLAIRSMDRRT